VEPRLGGRQSWLDSTQVVDQQRVPLIVVDAGLVGDPPRGPMLQ